VHEIEGEGRYEQGQDSKKGQLAGKELTHRDLLKRNGTAATGRGLAGPRAGEEASREYLSSVPLSHGSVP
jgi:hypothetical protein